MAGAGDPGPGLGGEAQPAETVEGAPASKEVPA